VHPADEKGKEKIGEKSKGFIPMGSIRIQAGTHLDAKRPKWKLLDNRGILRQDGGKAGVN